MCIDMGVQEGIKRNQGNWGVTVSEHNQLPLFIFPQGNILYFFCEV